jgi:nanoRNase/pAp phosphatase (c-di-AMP/oligoRNAs hydrolase)
MMRLKVPTAKNLWEENLEQAAALVQSNENFLFSADIDPDSVGAMVSLALYLRIMGKQVYIILSNSLGENLDHLEKMIEYNKIHTLRNADEIAGVKNSIDVVFFCDTANSKLVPFFPTINEHLLSRNVPVIEIDHHFGADSEKLVDQSVTLYQNANATTEITGELLKKIHQKNPSLPHPFNQRNIVISILTGILGDTMGGRVVSHKQSYVQWMGTLGNKLKRNTRLRKPNGVRPGDDRTTKFANPQQIQKYLTRLSREQEICLNALQKRMVPDGDVESLNLLNSTYSEVEAFCRPFDSPWFTYILGFLLSQISDSTTSATKLGCIYFHGKNAEDKDCIYIKIRRSGHYSGIDLRTTESHLRNFFQDKYMGGGGHPGAVSFRVHCHDETEFLASFEQVVTAIKKTLV